jgi:hypothetical protein
MEFQLLHKRRRRYQFYPQQKGGKGKAPGVGDVYYKTEGVVKQRLIPNYKGGSLVWD